MKSVWFFAFAGLLLVACGDSSEPSKENNKSIIVFDSVSNQPMIDCKIRLDYIFEKDDDYTTGEIIPYPNPVINNVFFHFQITEQGIYSIDIVNQVNSNSYNLMKDTLENPGTYQYLYNLNDSVQIEEGFYSVYLKHLDIIIDSTTLFYIKDENRFKYNNSVKCYNYYAYENKTDMQGKIYINLNDFKLFGKSFIRVYDNGNITSRWTINDSILVSVFDGSTIIKQKVFPFRLLKEDYLIYMN